MTLIITAICKDGVAVCSDKRRTVKNAQHTTFYDDLQKIFRFTKVDVLAFNHGINRIRGKSWDAYLTDFEASSVSQGMSLSDLVTAFKSFMDAPISEELSANVFDENIGFVFCACPPSSTPEVRELFWKKSIVTEDKTHRGLVRTGDGAHYLNQELQAHPNINTVEHWAELSVEDGLSQLEALFNAAITARLQQGGKEFSDSFDSDTLKGQPLSTADSEDVAEEP